MPVRVARTDVQGEAKASPAADPVPSDRRPSDADHGALRPTDRLELLASIARAYYEQDLTQEEVARLHGISRSQISRYLQEARDQGIVQIRIVTPDERDGDAEEALRRAFPHLREVVVARVFNRDPSFVRRAVGRAAGGLIDRLVRPGQVICVGAGRTLAGVTAAITPRRLGGVIVVPATGNAGHAALDSDYSSIARAMAAALGGVAYSINAPAILGPGASASELEASNPQIREALATARRADVFLLGLGSLAADLIFVRTGLISGVDLDAVRADGAVGDVCGSFFDATGRHIVGPFHDRVVGIGPDELRAATLVVGCAGGAEKVPAIAGALRGRLVNGLVTDEHTAAGVLEVVKGDGRTGAVPGEQREGDPG